jgi:sterol desaturase/sphingolipid hydroxylase (fatty acid hydroxylase superfamily)
MLAHKHTMHPVINIRILQQISSVHWESIQENATPVLMSFLQIFSINCALFFGSCFLMSLFIKETGRNKYGSRLLPSFNALIIGNCKNLALKSLMLLFAKYYTLYQWDDIHWGALRSLIFFVPFSLLHDTVFFFCHRLLHTKYLFHRFHHIHHRIISPVPLASNYESFVDHIVGNLFLIYLPILFPIPFVTLSCYSVVELLGSMLAHSGYMFDSSVEFHDNHHKYRTCNFASIYTHWDKLFGSYKKV